jgi:hypothetical protein
MVTLPEIGNYSLPDNKTKIFNVKRIWISLIFTLTLTAITFGQETEKILEEGKLLYRLEKASWYGTDDFLARFINKRDSIGGYLSYVNNKNQVINIFFKRDNPFHILVRYYFDSIPATKPILIDSSNNTATRSEIDLITIRQDAIQKISDNTDNFFTFYQNTSLNPIPLINKDGRKVFILTGPQISNIVIIGNDYLLTYDNKNRFVRKEKIHQTIIQYPYKADKSDNALKSTIHSHVLSDCISSTDICTLLLYKDFVEWKQHYVISKKYVSIFDLEKENLVIMTKKAWDKINKHQTEKE